MPLILAAPKQVTFNVNAVKVVSTPNDNDLNTTTIYPYEGFYDAATKVFTPLQPLDEYILDQAAYASLMIKAKTYYDKNLTSDPMGIYLAQKVILYDWLASELGETGYTLA
jgi:hypothetical protein